jgi:hypothetical protein
MQILHPITAVKSSGAVDAIGPQTQLFIIERKFEMKKYRECSNSITQLVKIVAREVVEEVLEEKEKKARQKSDSTWNPDKLGVLNNVKDCINIHAERAGNDWSQEEDNFLVLELDKAIKTIAQNHKRNPGAIRARISRKELFRYRPDQPIL